MDLTALPPRLAAIVVELGRSSHRCLWTGPEVDARYCRRSPRVVMEEQRGAINFSSPCVDLCALLAWRCGLAGLATTLVLSEVKRPLQGVKFQASVEHEDEVGTFVLGFSETAFHAYRGVVEVSRHRARILRALWDPAEHGERGLLEHFEPEGLEGIPRLFDGYDLAADLRFHRARNNRARFFFTRMRAERKRGESVLPIAIRWQS